MKCAAGPDTLDEQPSNQLNSTDWTANVSATNVTECFAHSASTSTTMKRPSEYSPDERDPKRSKMASIAEDEPARDSAPTILLHHRSGPAIRGLKNDWIKAEGDPADYAKEVMRSGLYRGFTRVLVQCDVVSLWQFDRMGVMHSRRFFCARGRRQILFYLAVAIVHSGFNKFSFQLMVDYANRDAFKFPPFIDAYLWPEAHDKLREQDFFAQIRFLYDYPSSYEALLFNYNDTVLCVDHDLQVSSSWPFETEPAHSSTKDTAPSSADDASPAPTSNSSPLSTNDTSPPHSSLTTSFAITGRPIYAQPGVTGRGTVVYPLSPPQGVVDYDPKEPLVAKLSWQPSGRAAEARIIRYIRKAIPDRWRNHVTDVKCSKQVAAKAMALPRLKLMRNMTESVKKRLEVPEVAQMKKWAKRRRELRFEQEWKDVFDAFEERDFHAIVTTRYLPLKEVKNADEFMTVFKDVVKVHYVIYKTTGILHRDLSVNNVMFIRCNDRVFGILNDWDLAVPEAQSSPPTVSHRMGTAAYMALNLLKSPDNSVPHLYCYDLESFAWILIWCAYVLLFNGKEVPFNEREKDIQKWTDNGEWRMIRCVKFAFIIEEDPPTDSITPGMKGLLASWISPVMEGIHDTFVRRLIARKNRSLRCPLVENDFFVFSTFMRVLEPDVPNPEEAVWATDEGVDSFLLSLAPHYVLCDEPCLKRAPPTTEPIPYARAARRESPPSPLVSSSAPSCFLVTGPLLRAQKGVLDERGTIVIPLAYPRSNDPAQPGCSSIDERLVPKMSWRPSNRLPEDITLRFIQRKIPTHWRKYVTDLKCSVSHRSDELGLPRKKITALVKEVRQEGTGPKGEAKFRGAMTVDGTQDRVFRVLVSQRYLPLNQVKDREEFKTVFKDVVKGHYVIYKKTGILHRDLSVSNIMFLRRSGRIIGALNDWDLSASEVRSSPPTALHRTGTAAFMALNLLKRPDGSVPHLYCYDLESFAWILVWCAYVLLFNGKEVSYDEREEDVQEWTKDGNWKTLSSLKFEFITENPPTDTITASMKGLLESCISPVMKAMRNTLLRRRMNDRSPSESPLVENDFFMFSNFMRVLEPAVPSAEEAVFAD
ncbi:uncharacterized protein STEHIDRAFT_158452 [Stereum hirsutum FP-91666 SS1]|uniref:uncharacterized protein n=1 Tax=Stereum hirsutum (strain FP-91666) TaxID=721885 RepID=UPI0004449B07|nr:uncharacterized protein STEHIDRAFT_158452 [Stereum hirsutum FP-91666 SS1]EIM84736.1 hypothetical protein STEHIDRAFT_158452 [Stereum hirsutum FP-91666 SS1]